MTSDHDFKKLVRARMAKTGESYSSAHRQLRTALDPTGRGAFLVARRLLTQQQLDSALAEEDRTGKSLGRLVLDLSLVSEQDLMAALADELGIDLQDALALRRHA